MVRGVREKLLKLCVMCWVQWKARLFRAGCWRRISHEYRREAGRPVGSLRGTLVKTTSHSFSKHLLRAACMLCPQGASLVGEPVSK